ncbi:MAG: VWA domain-containing protein [Actinomycetota bacterium]|nr:VWA domain-containing protein [Actinomycetota bacterium]
MTQDPSFTVQIDQDAYLPAGTQIIDAMITVSLAEAADGRTTAPTAAQVIMLDCSGSMGGDKLHQAKRAALAAIDTLRDGVAFAVVAGTETARMIFPAHTEMAEASPDSREAAARAISHLRAEGGTAIGSWLLLADDLLTARTADIKHGLLLTDGRNEHETPQRFQQALSLCTGHFVCDCRGVGDGWEAAPLLAIADTLHGSAEGLTDPAALAEEFRALTETLMGKELARVTLRLWTPAHSTVRFLKQVYPRIVDITDTGTALGERVREYDTGQWGAEFRQFHLSVQVPEGAAGEEMVAARVRMSVAGFQSDPAPVWVHWTDDPVLATRMNPALAAITGQVELADVIDRGVAARAAGEHDRATVLLGRAVELAERFGHPETVKLLNRMVEVDEATGTVRVHRDMAGIDAEMVALTSRKTVRVRRTDGH